MEVAANILAIEDSRHVRKFLRTAFSTSDIRLSLASSLEEAFQRIRESVPDLILTDVFLPDGNALDHVAGFWKSAGRTLPVIAMSGSEEEGLEKAALKSGCDAWLGKPIPFAELALTISRCLGHREISGAEGVLHDCSGSPENHMYR